MNQLSTYNNCRIHWVPLAHSRPAGPCLALRLPTCLLFLRLWSVVIGYCDCSSLRLFVSVLSLGVLWLLIICSRVLRCPAALYYCCCDLNRLTLLWTFCSSLHSIGRRLFRVWRRWTKALAGALRSTPNSTDRTNTFWDSKLKSYASWTGHQAPTDSSSTRMRWVLLLLLRWWWTFIYKRTATMYLTRSFSYRTAQWSGWPVRTVSSAQLLIAVTTARIWALDREQQRWSDIS